MTGIVVVIVVVVLLGAISWSWMASARAEKRSVDEYEHRLDVLGHVAKRSDAAAQVQAPRPNELARPHVRPAETHGAQRLWSTVDPPSTSRPRLDLPQQAASVPVPVFGDDIDFETVPDSPAPEFSESEVALVNDPLPLEGPLPRFGADDLVDDNVEGKPVRSTSRRKLQRMTVSGNQRQRRVMTSAAAVVVAAVAVGGWRYAEAHQGNHNTSLGTSTKSHSTKAHSSPRVPTSASGPLRSMGVANGLAVYSVPSGSYSITFSAVEPCWIGVESPGSTSGPWLAMKTVTNGTWTYQANGSVVVRIGAPKTLTVKIDGNDLVLSGSVNPYDIMLSAPTTTSA